MKADDLLDGVDNLTWESNVAGRITWRLWASELDSTVVTPIAKRLEAQGLIKRFTGWRHGAGYVELAVPVGSTWMGPTGNLLVVKEALGDGRVRLVYANDPDDFCIESTADVVSTLVPIPYPRGRAG